jgi:hypothetical protein
MKQSIKGILPQIIIVIVIVAVGGSIIVNQLGLFSPKTAGAPAPSGSAAALPAPVQRIDGSSAFGRGGILGFPRRNPAAPPRRPGRVPRGQSPCGWRRSVTDR